MTDEQNTDDSIFNGLKVLVESAFPKKCNNCGKLFESAEDFITETEKISSNHSGLKEGRGEAKEKILEVFRNCPCGSTLMDYFNDRRDLSDKGLKRRENFAQLVKKLQNLGVDAITARDELLKVLRGDKSDIINKYTKKI